MFVCAWWVGEACVCVLGLRGMKSGGVIGLTTDTKDSAYTGTARMGTVCQTAVVVPLHTHLQSNTNAYTHIRIQVPTLTGTPGRESRVERAVVVPLHIYLHVHTSAYTRTIILVPEPTNTRASAYTHRYQGGNCVSNPPLSLSVGARKKHCFAHWPLAWSRTLGWSRVKLGVLARLLPLGLMRPPPLVGLLVEAPAPTSTLSPDSACEREIRPPQARSKCAV